MELMLRKCVPLGGHHVIYSCEKSVNKTKEEQQMPQENVLLFVSFRIHLLWMNFLIQCMLLIQNYVSIVPFNKDTLMTGRKLISHLAVVC